MEKKKWWKIGTLIAIAVLVFAIDIIAKYIIDAKIESGSTEPICRINGLGEQF